MVIAEATAAQEDDMLSAGELQYAALEAKLIEWGLTYSVELELPIADIVVSDDNQIRSTGRAPKDRVDEYRMQMQAGTIFPPILIRTPGNILIDGNTRIEAAKKVGRRTMPVLLVDTKTEAMHKILAASVNQMGGQRLTPEDAHAAAQLMLRLEYTDAAISRETGRDQSQVRKWRTQEDVLKRAAALDIDLTDVTRTTIETLADIRLEQPFIEAAKLFTEIRPKPKESREIVGQVVQAASEEAAIQVVTDLRAEMEVAGPPPKGRNRETGLAHAAIGNLVKFEGRPSAAFDPAKREQEMELWRRLEKVVASVIAALDTY